MRCSVCVTVQVPVGAERIRLPGSIFEDSPTSAFWLIDIEWQQDDNGNLCMSRFTDPVPEGRPGAPVPRAVREQLSCGSTPTILPLNARQRSLVATPVHRRGF